MRLLGLPSVSALRRLDERRSLLRQLRLCQLLLLQRSQTARMRLRQCASAPRASAAAATNCRGILGRGNSVMCCVGAYRVHLAWPSAVGATALTPLHLEPFDLIRHRKIKMGTVSWRPSTDLGSESRNDGLSLSRLAPARRFPEAATKFNLRALPTRCSVKFQIRPEQ